MSIVLDIRLVVGVAASAIAVPSGRTRRNRMENIITVVTEKIELKRHNGLYRTRWLFYIFYI